MAQTLRHGIDELSLTTRATLAVLAIASGVYTYLGVRDLLDGSATLTFLGAIIYSAAVSVGIYAFWSYLIRFLPHVREARIRRMLYGAMALGSVMIIAMSSWLNAAALAGSAALEQHLAEATESYSRDLDTAHNNALAAQSILPDIQLAADRFARLADQERQSGALTGTSGSGTVVQLLGQMSAQLTALAGQVSSDREEVDALKVMGLSPVGVLVFPRLVALTVVLPLLTVVANFAALAGAAAVAWSYSGITPDVFITRLREAIDMSTVTSGMIKAPFMALIIGIVAAVEGMKVGGSAESLGQRVTASVVKSIFVVILVDGLFAMFYAAIDF